MGNTLNRLLSGFCFKPSTATTSHESDQSLGPHGVTPATVSVSALAQHLLNFDATSRVPEGLSRHVISSSKAQAGWYRKLLGAWREAKLPPRTAEEVTWLVVQTLKGHQKEDIEGFLSFYGLPALEIEVSGILPSRPQGVEYVLQTLPVDARSVVDGDGINVYVDTADPRESSMVPTEVQEAAIARARARSVRDYKNANALHRSIVAAGYRVITSPNGEETLARKYKIRLRGIDAPENEMPYGKEAREALVKLVEGKRLRVSVYGNDRYGRFVTDVHCNGIFVQEKMLKRGFAWHYAAYDQRPEFAAWEKEARSAQCGLWALSNPEKPWDWRKDRRNEAQISVC